MLKLITLLITSSMTVMAGATISPALPQMQEFFKAESNSEFWVKLLLTLPGLFTGLAAPFAGAIIDRFGRKRLLAAAVFLYGIAGGTGCVLSSLTGLLIGRAFLGLAVAAIMTTSITLIADYYQGPQRNQVMGVQASFMGYGGVTFLLLGGFLASFSWRGPFFIYLSAFAVLPLVIFTITEPEVATEHTSNLAEDSDPKLPIITLISIYSLTFLTMVVFYMIPVQIPFYLRNFQVNSFLAGIAIAASTLASATMSLFYKNLKARLSFQGILICLFPLIGLGYIAVSVANSYAFVVLGLIVSGLGLGLFLPNMNVWLNAIAPVATRGRLLGGLTTAMFLGQFFSPILIQPIVQQIQLPSTFTVVGVAMLILAAAIAGALFANRFSHTA
ncbi:MFS transporter [Argonema antarcticum]|uniref:MFS transporter n=1 Tax=Argonema antarcticum TaxID=2942763 RepID=UPI00201249B1|nr:MFS transporter [Argonema antarcticum]MCL1472622.1 MFS transporter [Argonema antarcticum A004/B2]